MRELVRIVGQKEPHLTYRTRRLLPGKEMDVPAHVATIFSHLGYARRVMDVEEPRRIDPHTEGDNVAALRALAASLGLKVDGRWSAKRLTAEIEKARS
jgi:hypothetical protein